MKHTRRQLNNKNKSTMSKSKLEELKAIYDFLDSINQDMLEEERQCKAELEERTRLNLHGDAALEHYNAWMQRAHLEHLMIH